MPSLASPALLPVRNKAPPASPLSPPGSRHLPQGPDPALSLVLPREQGCCGAVQGATKAAVADGHAGLFLWLCPFSSRPREYALEEVLK